jgi:hypothetical protein
MRSCYALVSMSTKGITEIVLLPEDERDNQ